MPLHPNVRRCTHIQITGHRCGSPALKQEYFCYFHARMIKGVETRVDSQIHPVALLESAEAIQAAIMHTIDAVLKGTIDNKRANIVLKALYIAVRNSRNVYFHLNEDEMVRQVPNYAQQYLIEHAELNPTEPSTHVAPDAPVRGAEPISAADCHPEEAQACAKRRPADEGSVHVPADTDDRATLYSAKSGNGASTHPPHRPRPKNQSDNTPPLTSHQSQQWHQIKKLEACIEGAMRGNWRDVRTVFNAVGLTPFKPPIRQRAPHKKIV